MTVATIPSGTPRGGDICHTQSERPKRVPRSQIRFRIVAADPEARIEATSGA